MVPVTTNQSLLLYKSPFSHGFPMVFPTTKPPTRLSDPSSRQDQFLQGLDGQAGGHHVALLELPAHLQQACHEPQGSFRIYIYIYYNITVYIYI